MAEKHAREHQYAYKALSNLVTQADRSLMNKVGKDESSGQVFSLVGRLDHIKMGDLFQPAKPAHVEDYTKRKKLKAAAAAADTATNMTAQKTSHNMLVARFQQRSGSSHLLSDKFNTLVYQPKSKATQAKYELILNIVQSALIDQPQDAVEDATDQLIVILKDSAGFKKDAERKAAAKALLGEDTVTDEVFYKLYTISRSLTDYVSIEDKRIEALGRREDLATKDTEVAVLFDEDAEDDLDDEDDQDPYLAHVQDEFSSQSESELEETPDSMPETVKQSQLSASPEEQHIVLGVSQKFMNITKKNTLSSSSVSLPANSPGLLPASEDTLDPFTIDAFWIQRRVAEFDEDPASARETSLKILDILGTARDDRDLENKLILLLSPKRFSFIKILRVNRHAIYYRTKLAAAASQDEKNEIAETLSNTPGLQALYQTIFGDRGSAYTQRTVNMKEQTSIVNPRPISTQTNTNEALASHQQLKAGSPTEVLDLSKLSFDRFESIDHEQSIRLPSGTKKQQHDNYEEITVPALSPKPLDETDRPIEIKDLPPYAQSAFANFPSLNRIQSRLYPYAMGSDGNMLVCAPTGAGKTNVAMLTILRELGKHVLSNPNNNVAVSNNSNNNNDDAMDLGKMASDVEIRLALDAFKMVYIAPMKSLVAEMVGTFSQRLRPYGITVSELTGDSQLSKEQLDKTQLIVSTPEKWDIVTRKHGYDKNLLRRIKLVIVDEIHLLHDPRGAVLESIVARTLRFSEVYQHPIRLLGLSATLPNYIDVARFLRVDLAQGLFFFDNRFRPVPLQQIFIGINEKKAFKRQEIMNTIVYEKALSFVGKEQVLVFVHSRKDTAKTALYLRDLFLKDEQVAKLLDNKATQLLLEEEASKTNNRALKDLLPFGIGIHHAGMSRVDRDTVEDLFSAKHLQILVSTATLAWGVNLPAHTVIIKGTLIYSPEVGRWVDLSHMDVLQMFGRAGRPQYDSLGEAILITQHNALQTYLSALNQQMNVESQLIKALPDALNAEIVLGNLNNIDAIVAWIGYTYYFIRMIKCPHLYGLANYLQDHPEDTLYVQHRRNLAHTVSIILDRAGLVLYDRRSGTLRSTELGRIASHYYISHETLSRYNTMLKPTMSDIDIVRLFSLSNEFSSVTIKAEEKIELSKLLERIPIPIKEGLDDPLTKVNVLLQAYISQINLEGFALMADMAYITQSAGRLFRALLEIALHKRWALLVTKLLDFSKMVDHRMWLSMTPLRQFKKLPPEVLAHIEKKDMEWDRLYDLSAAALEEFFRKKNLGKVIHKFVHAIPRTTFQATIQPITRSTLRFMVRLKSDFYWDPKYHHSHEPFYLFVEDVDGESLLHFETFLLKHKYAADELCLSFFVDIDPELLPPHFFIRVVSARWLASETSFPVSVTKLLLPAKDDPFIELLDLQLVPVNQTKLYCLKDILYLDNQCSSRDGFSNGDDMVQTQGELTHESDTKSQFERMVALRIRQIYPRTFFQSHLNPIQTQVYHALTDLSNLKNNLLVCAPPSSGTDVLLVLALLELFTVKPSARAVLIVPRCDMAKTLSAMLDTLLGGGDGDGGDGVGGSRCGLCKVHLLEETYGSAPENLKKLQAGGVLVSTPTVWDHLSQRWVQRKSIQEIDLFAITHLEFLSSDLGPLIEIIASRMRYIFNQLADDDHDDDHDDDIDDNSAVTKNAGRKNMSESDLAPDLIVNRPFCRIVAFASPITNAKDVANWLGVSKRNTFNFSPAHRLTPLDLHIKSYNLPYADTRLYAISKEAFLLIARHTTRDQQTIIYTPSKSQTLSMALDLVGACLLEQQQEQQQEERDEAVAKNEKDMNEDGFRPYQEALESNSHTSRFFKGTSKDLYHIQKKISDSLVTDLLKHGVGVLQESSKHATDNVVVEDLYHRGIIQVLILPYTMVWTLVQPKCDLVLLSDTQFYNGKEHAHMDYTLVDLMHMCNTANTESAACMVLCESSKKAFLKTFLTQAVPLESHLDHVLHDPYLAEVIAGIIENKQDAVDYLTWTLFYRRLSKNANYYRLRGLSPTEISEHLSELVESTLADLEQAKMIAIENEMDVSALNLGMISAYYHLEYATIELFHMSLNERIGLSGLLQVLSNAAEFSGLPIRKGEEKVLNYLSLRLPHRFNEMVFNDPHTKAYLLLQAHFSRLALPSELQADMDTILERTHTLLLASIDVMSNNGWLRPALVAMEAAQMVTQAVWDHDSPLKQVPYVSTETVLRCKERGVETVIDFINMEEDDRVYALGKEIYDQHIQEIAQFCNLYPSVELTTQLVTRAEDIVEEGTIVVEVGLQRDMDEEESKEEYETGRKESGKEQPVHAPFLPYKRPQEGWWVVLGDQSANLLATLKYVTFSERKTVKLQFTAPSQAGVYDYKVFLMCDAYLGLDEAVSVQFTVHPSTESMASDSE